MQGIQPQSLTNIELARYLENNGINAASQEELRHVALRFIEIFRHQETESTLVSGAAMEVTRVPYVHP